MKLQISYDLTNLSEALEIAKKTAPFADVIEVGNPLIISHGLDAIKAFRTAFPDKEIVADAKIVDRVTETIPLLSKAGANYITVLYGTSNKVIQKATSVAHEADAKILLDLIDPETMSQAAHDAESLDVDRILFHYPHESHETYSHLDEWETVKGNTDLPIFISGRIAKDQIKEIIKLKPKGIVVGEAITKASDPEKEAKYFKELIS